MIEKTTMTAEQMAKKEKYLLSEAVMPDGTIKTKMRCTEENGLTVAVTEEICGSSEHWLLLINSKDTLQRFVFPAERNHNILCFDLSKASEELFAPKKTWLCYLVWEDEQGFICKRLRHGREPLYYGGEKKLSGSQILLRQEDSQRYWATVAETEIDGKMRCLVPVMNESRNTLAMQAFGSAELKMIREELIWRKDKMMRDEEEVAQIKFSVVVAAYMAESYIEETLESIVKQDIGFEENIQLILVDDGSTDRTAEICDEYATRYPKNVIVIHKENGGVASARNEGKKYAVGKYINFCDSDDKFSLNAFSAVWNFATEHEGEMDVVTMPLYFFEAQSGAHWQNYKFDKGNRVIDLWEEYTASDMFCNASFFVREATEEFTFDGTLPCGEDIKFVAQVLLKRMALGVVTECNYWYRKRSTNDSLINTSRMKKSWYFEYFDNMVLELMRYSRKMHGFTPYFIQNTIMMDLQWRFKMHEIPEGVLTKYEEKKYRNKIEKALALIDEQIIKNQRWMNADYLTQIFEMKYSTPAQLRYMRNDIKLFVQNNHIRSASDMATQFNFLEIEKDSLRLEGNAVFVGFPKDINVNVYVSVAGNYYQCVCMERQFEDENCFGRLKTTIAFRGQIPITNAIFGKWIRICVAYNGYFVERMKYSYGKFSPVSEKSASQYYEKNGMVLRGTKHGIRLEQILNDKADVETKILQLSEQEKEIFAAWRYEERYLADLKEKIIVLSDELKGSEYADTVLTSERFGEIVALRKEAKLFRKDKPVWLISDRMNAIGDNGEALFRYLMQKENLPVRAYFVLEENCPYYETMKSVGPTVAYGSKEHKLLHLVADVIISSQAGDYVQNPFGEYRTYYRDFLGNQKVVFLQHGVTKDDLSEWLNKYRKNFAGIVTAAERERKSFLKISYGYEPEKVWLTGFPRFDRLYEDTKRQIVICPTWRMYLKDYSEKRFRESNYYKFYQELIENPKLQDTIREYQYTLAIKLHPQMLRYADVFNQMEGLQVLDDDMTYSQIFAESSLMVTDYSSTAMDFAFMRKPVIYCQFDSKEFFSGKHMYKAGYFDYLMDGFGPVTETVEQTVEVIITHVRNDCKLSSEYAERCDSFFVKKDNENCERVYEKICELI